MLCVSAFPQLQPAGRDCLTFVPGQKATRSEWPFLADIVAKVFLVANENSWSR
jgi:hypothetical protein